MYDSVFWPYNSFLVKTGWVFINISGKLSQYIWRDVLKFTRGQRTVLLNMGYRMRKFDGVVFLDDKEDKFTVHQKPHNPCQGYMRINT